MSNEVAFGLWEVAPRLWEVAFASAEDSMMLRAGTIDGPAGYDLTWPRCSPFLYFPPHGQVAQLVEQRTENPRVGGSIPSLATKHHNDLPHPVESRHRPIVPLLSPEVARR